MKMFAHDVLFKVLICYPNIRFEFEKMHD